MGAYDVSTQARATRRIPYSTTQEFISQDGSRVSHIHALWLSDCGELR